ncbi:unnamed protein product [Discosporangium mesarthrocarpum]
MGMVLLPALLGVFVFLLGFSSVEASGTVWAGWAFAGKERAGPAILSKWKDTRVTGSHPPTTSSQGSVEKEKLSGRGRWGVNWRRRGGSAVDTGVAMVKTGVRHTHISTNRGPPSQLPFKQHSTDLSLSGQLEKGVKVKTSPSYLQWEDVAWEAAGLKHGNSSADSAEPHLMSHRSNRNHRIKSKTKAQSGRPTQEKTVAGSAVVTGARLTFKEAMFAGAISRSIAQTCMQPANVVKTLLQGRGTSSQLSNLSFRLLTRGAGAQFLLSLPHGALNFATLEVVRGCTAKAFPENWREKTGALLDFFSSAVATTMCSVVSTPQMVLTDRIMAGMYPNLLNGIRDIQATAGWQGFYTGWGANVAQKIPSYGLTWVFFQQFKRLHQRIVDRPLTNCENFILGAAAAGATVCLMIPLDTVKTRLVTQPSAAAAAATAAAGGGQVVLYKGVLDCALRVAKEEGVGALYRSLTPRLVSVVPMIGIQFGIYEFVRGELIASHSASPKGLFPSTALPSLGKMFRPQRQQEYVKDYLHNVVLLEEELV